MRIIPKPLRRILHSQAWMILGMLLCLHLGVMSGLFSPLGRGLLMSHIGLFLLWQPFWAQSTALSWSKAALILAACAAFAWLSNAWIIMLWLGLLVGLLSSHFFATEHKHQRLFLGLSCLYLTGLILLFMLPLTLQHPLNHPHWLLHTGFSLYWVGLTWLGYQHHSSAPRKQINFFYGAIILLGLMVSVLASLAFYNLEKTSYGMALLQGFGISSLMLGLLAWLWNPIAGFKGLGELVTGQILHLGSPFEAWIERVAQSAALAQDEEAYLQTSLQELQTLPWYKGVRWFNPQTSGELGDTTGQHISFYHPSLQLTFFTAWRVSPALQLQGRLIAHLLGELYLAKQRERQAQQQTYLHAIYETGARLTHDVKNILQSLKGLCSAANYTDADNALDFAQLMQNQLPQITQRLESTLDKLQSPEQKSSERLVPAHTWWVNAQERYAKIPHLKFSLNSVQDDYIPIDLFNSVLDNLLQNAQEKRLHEPHIQISIHLVWQGGISLEVHDTGSAIPKEKAKYLFMRTVPSENGMGIGLYQANKQALQEHYALRIAHNQAGQVVFGLYPHGMD